MTKQYFYAFLDDMFGLGFSEVLILGLIAFLVFGPVEFPKVARNFIKIFNELRRALTEVRTELYDVQNETGQKLRQITDHIKEDWEKELTDLNEKTVLKTQKPLSENKNQSPLKNFKAKKEQHKESQEST